MQAQKEAPLDMQCKDEFVIQSIVANHKRYHSKNGATTKDITPEMFNKDSGYEIEECKLRVVNVAPPQPPSPVKIGSDKDSKASNEHVEQQNTSFQVLTTNPKKYCVKPNNGVVLPRSTCDIIVELRKQISCSLLLSNKSDNFVAFKVKTTNPKKYFVRPNIGVVLPRSTCDITVTMQGQKEAPPNMQCIDKFLIQSVVANPGATTKDITPKMFKKEFGDEVEECKFKVVYVPPPQPPSPVREGSDEDLSPRASSFSDKARALISKLTEERNSAIEKNKRLEQEL
ncbi:hypothetical protein TSUD_266210, partial [Trifolium subterraneum]